MTFTPSTTACARPRTPTTPDLLFTDVRSAPYHLQGNKTSLEFHLHPQEQRDPMSTSLDSLNLRPQEKRILVVIAVVVFVVLNLVLVVPRFKDYGKIKEQLKATRNQHR